MNKPYHESMNRNSPMYVYATEMVSKYYSKLDMKNKRVLTISGSGDQVINAYFFGTKEVVGFDINERAFFILELKWFAILNLPYAEFIEFFGGKIGNGNFNFNLYEKIEKDLSSRAKNFFRKFYAEFDYNGKKMLKSDYFRQRSFLETPLVEINAYLKNEKNYLKCREIIRDKKIVFFILDINDITTNKRVEGRFDIINLSNALNYITHNTEIKDIPDLLTVITKEIYKKVKKGGLFFGYSYSPTFYEIQGLTIPPTSRLKTIKKLRERTNFKIPFVRFGGMKKNTFDRINIFQI